MQRTLAGRIAVGKELGQLDPQPTGAPAWMELAQQQRSLMESVMLGELGLTARIVARLQCFRAAELQSLEQMADGAFAQMKGVGDTCSVLALQMAMKDSSPNCGRNSKWHDRPPCAKKRTS